MKLSRLTIRPWFVALLLTIAALWVPAITATAADGLYETPSQAFSWYSKGPGCLHLKFLIFDSSAKRSLKDGYFALRSGSDDGIDFLMLHETSTSNNAYVQTTFQNTMSSPGSQLIYLTNDNDVSSLYYVGSSTKTIRNVKREKSGGDCYVEMDWYYPPQFAGKKMTLYLHNANLWEIGTGRQHELNDNGYAEIGDIEFDDITLEAHDIILGAEDGDEGLLKVPLSSSCVMNWVEASYTDENGISIKVPRVTLPKDTYFCYVKLPSNTVHRNLAITANVTLSTPDASSLSNPEWPKECNGNVVVNVKDEQDAIVHAPRLLRAELLSDVSESLRDAGAVKLQWKVNSPEYKDIIDGDAFLVQRSLTGRLEDFADIGSVIFNSGQSEYEYKDNEFIESLTPELIDQKLGIPLVRYRVLRASTQQLWGSDRNPTAAYVQPQMNTLSLLQPGNVKADWSDETQRKIKVTWSYPQRSNYEQVWDSRAVMQLELQRFRQDGSRIDSTVTALTEAEIQACEMEVTLTKSCSNYQLRLLVDSKTSPIGRATGKIFTVISNNNEYTAFWERVMYGETGLNAILTDDIYASRLILAADANKPYTGNFNGNGYSLSFDIENAEQPYAAVFGNLANGAVVANLTVKGYLVPKAQKAGGMVGKITGGSAFIENCIVATYLKSKVEGDALHGGVVAEVGGDAFLHVSNTYFSGQIVSYNSSNISKCGGFVGFREKGTFVKLSNCYFAPSSASQGINNTGTFIRNAEDDDTYGILEDCLYRQVMGAAQGRQSINPPNNWWWKNGWPDVALKTFAKVTTQNQYGVAVPQHKFYYENLGHIDKESLTTQTLQSSVVLRWKNVDDEPVDYYEVWRHDLQKEIFEPIATQLAETVYEDKTTSPVKSYEYFVRGVNNCEGTRYEDTDTVSGNCVQTGKVEGYLRMTDGTGIPGQEIIITLAEQGITETCTTDENGYFRKEGLPYFNNTETVYKVSVNINGFADERNLLFGTEPGENHVKDIVFTIEKSIKISGYVLYNGTSIPVQGVSFRVNSREVRNASGKITTDYEGKFSFRLLEGDYMIQAVKDGHVFYQKGYYHENNDTTQLYHNFTIDKAGIYFYDDTKVKLIGRVAGGKNQGALPLENSLGRNNLGDELKMVFALEGDKSSRLVWDIQDHSKKEHDTIYYHKRHDSKFDYHTKVHTTLNRMEVEPDVHTGEYMVWLPPVKWKIQQITAKGYPTLFQDGQTGDVIDLTDSLTLKTDHYDGQWTVADKSTVKSVDVSYHAIYNRIYHTPVIISYKQKTYDAFDHFGDLSYNASNLAGDVATVPLCYAVKREGWPENHPEATVAKYTFGYPVFDTFKNYELKLAATEKYYYNNNIKNDTIDVVKLSGGVVTVQNGFWSSTHRETVKLDNQGEGSFRMALAQSPYLLTEKEALRTVTMTLLMDGTHYEAEPLKGYVLNTYKKAGAKDYYTTNIPQLIDILRDPPGGGSSAKLSKGSTLKYSYTVDWSAKGGVNMSLSFGNTLKQWIGASVGAPAALTDTGTIIDASSLLSLDFGLVVSGSGKIGYSYTATTTADISTSTAATMVGAEADVYIGAETTIAMTPSVAIRAIPESMWQQLEGEREAGRAVLIAQGVDKDGKKVYLVRDEIMTIGPKAIKSTFAHSQTYIINQLIPKLEQECKALLFSGSKEDAQRQADKTGEVVYWSLRNHNDPNYGLVNTKKEVVMGDEVWDYVHNTTIDTPQEGINYMIVRPRSGKNSNSQEDCIADFCQSMLAWARMIAQNEKEKLGATDLVKNFDIDGGAPLTYSEEFSSEYSVSASMQFPWEHNGLNVAGLLNYLVKFINKKWSSDKEHKNYFGSDVWGSSFKFNITPVTEYNVKTPYGQDKKFNRKESFTISMDKKSHLIVDVYRVRTDVDNVAADGNYDVFVNRNFNDQVDLVDDKVAHWTVYGDLDKVSKDDLRYPRSFVYRTRGGATCRPWEGQRVTEFYTPGTELDARTKKIENPVITMDKQSLSGVPYGEPARFKLYLANESEQPEAAYPYFDLYQVENSNPKGAKLMLDGMPLSGNARTMEIVPGKVTEKTLEVYASEDFDYENLRLRLRSLNDIRTYQEVQFSVHFLQTAGSVAISTPGDKWIMNTDASFEEGRGWYMPVVISGFDKNQHNFDHIEFQYKESTRGDDYWTNLCGFYKDKDIYAAASGTKEMIPENGNITTRFFGDGTVMEKAYDLRAVLFCRNGSGFLTNASKVISGVKDTRLPKLFGSPEPKDGVLGVGENIIFNFSEDIEYNYLQETTNFEVKGETNETAISEEPSLQFTGKGYAESEARRNFADKSITIEVMIKPDASNTDMPIFSHGRDGKQLQLWLTKDKHLKAVIDDSVLVSKELYTALGFQRVALVIDNVRKEVSIISNKVEATMQGVTYSGYGPVIFGATNQTDVNRRTFYKGRMLQGRVWNRAMDLITLNSYGNQLLTGYEMGLTDYYPMNEGRGDYATDLAQGAHLKLNGASWALPRGMSLYLDKKEQRDIKGLQIRPDYIERTADQDYTLMFWFKTNDGGTLLSNGSGRDTEVGASNKFFIGFEGKTLKYRSNGHEYDLGNSYIDGLWHHYAMTVNRSHQVASIYIDTDLKAQFMADSLGGMAGKTYLGNMVWKEEGDDNDVVHQQNAFTGYIDGFILFKQALPQTLIRRYNSKSLSGAEKGLVTNVDFSRQERQKNGDLTMQPFAKNRLVSMNEDGESVEKNDSVFVDPVSDIVKRIDQNVGAPIQSYEELRNLNFSYVGHNHQLLVNVDELDSRINKRTVYVTVSDIPDLNGNFMASPATVAVFVDRNPLRWAQKTYKATLAHTYETDYQFDINILNNSGAAHTYTVDNLPKWLSVNSLTDVIDAKSEQTLTFTISKDANVGNYDNIIYLTDENGLSEPLMLNITIEGEMPHWDVPAVMKQFSMSIVGQVKIGDDVVTDSRDIVGAFDMKGRCMGVGNINYNTMSGESLVYLTVYDSVTVASDLKFKLWHYETGKTMVLTPADSVKFKPETIVGTTKRPLLLTADTQYIQTIDLYPGWNWVSLNVINDDYRKVPKLLSSFDWREGDMLTDETHNLSLMYQKGQWISNKGSDALNKIMLSVDKSYRVKVSEYVKVEFVGKAIKSSGDRTITVTPGWNSIGFTPMVNLPVATALADYFDEAKEGDLVKSKTEFAMFTEGANGSREWKGNLKYMKPGEGYMIFRSKKDTVKFIYPFYEPNAAFFEESGNVRSARAASYSDNMTLTATADGIELMEGDRLVAYAGGEVRGEAVLTSATMSQTTRLAGGETAGEGGAVQGVFYLTISGNESSKGTVGETSALSFAIERDGEVIATTAEVMTYKNNAISGTPSEPTKISFASIGLLPQHGWYTLQGIKLDKRPTKRGVYIYNGRKQVIH